MKTLIIVIVLTLSSLCWGDAYNGLLWNRSNALDQNGVVDDGPWFEWWYFKVVVPETGESFFMTYGVVNPWDQESKDKSSKSFVSLGAFKQKVLIESDFSNSQFQATYNDMHVRIGNNEATESQLAGEVESTNHEHRASWNVTVEKNWSFNAMGWGMGVEGLSSIYWYPAQASAYMSGEIVFDGRVIKLNHAPAYQDRNWGRSFPSWWTWIVSNHFDGSPDTVLVAGGGRPKIFNAFSIVDGLEIGLKYEGNEYKFRTTDGDRLQFSIEIGSWQVEGQNRDARIEIEASADKNEMMDLPFQTPQGPVFHDFETLTGQMTVRLFVRNDDYENGPDHSLWKQIANLHTNFAGLEYGTPEEEVPRSFSFDSIQMTKQPLH